MTDRPLSAEQQRHLINTARWPLKIHFNGLGELAPLEDVTPREAVCLCAMLACAFANSYVDHSEYARANGLLRHFKEPSNG